MLNDLAAANTHVEQLESEKSHLTTELKQTRATMQPFADITQSLEYKLSGVETVLKAKVSIRTVHLTFPGLAYFYKYSDNLYI